MAVKMKSFDLQRMALNDVPLDFLWEVAFRSLYTFILVFLFLKITGRRGVRQMSLFEVLINLKTCLKENLPSLSKRGSFPGKK